MRNVRFSPPVKDESPQPSSLVSDNDTTVNLEQIERINSMSMSTSYGNDEMNRILFHRSTS